MTIKENVTLYKCDFCKKELKRKHAMINHEENCSCNPKHFDACSNCHFLKVKPKTIHYDVPCGYDGEMEERTISSQSFHCTKLNKEMYPSKVVRKKIINRFPETFQGMEQMPNECEHF